MPKINLGRVKGDPFRYEDLTDAQKLELKGEKGDMPIIKAGTTTIVNFDQNAKVTSETNGDVTSFNFQIPVGQKPPYYGAYTDFPEEGDPDRTYIDDTVDPRLMYTWDAETQKYILTGGAGGADGGSVDIPITLTATGWTGDTAPYRQTITVPQMREGMTPLFFLASEGDVAQYAFSLITGYEAGYAEITFYAADIPAVDLDLTLKGIPAQELEYVDNTVVFLVEPSMFTLNTTTQRYEATIPVEGMTEGTGGVWDIVRSGPVLTDAESRIALSITDVDRMDGAIKITCLEAPEQRYMMSIAGAYPDAEPGTVILAGMQAWFDRVDELKKTTLDIKTMLNGFGKVSFYGFENGKTIKLTVDSDSKRFGAVFLCTQSHSCNITWSGISTNTFPLPGTVAPTVTVDGVVMIIEMANQYQHGFIIVGGSASSAKIEKEV